MDNNAISVEDNTVFEHRFALETEAVTDIEDEISRTAESLTLDKETKGNIDCSMGFVNPCALELDLQTESDVSVSTNFETEEIANDPPDNNASGNGFVNPCAFEEDFHKVPELTVPKVKGKDSATRQYVSKCLEIGILVTAILLVWALFSLPTVFYIVTPRKVNSNNP